MLKEVRSARPRSQLSLALQVSESVEQLCKSTRNNVAPRLRKDRQVNLAQCETNSNVRPEESLVGDIQPRAFSLSGELDESGLSEQEDEQQLKD